MKNAIITSKIKKMYEISTTKNRVSVHNPAYVNVDKDADYSVENNGVTLTIQNSKVSVALWLDRKMMHVTVYS